MNSLLLLPAPQRHPGDGSALAEVVRPPVHRHGGGRGLLPGAALSVAEGRGDAAAGSGHAEVSSDRPVAARAERWINLRGGGEIKTIATETPGDVNHPRLSTSPFHFLHLTSECARTLEFPPPCVSS